MDLTAQRRKNKNTIIHRCGALGQGDWTCWCVVVAFLFLYTFYFGTRQPPSRSTQHPTLFFRKLIRPPVSPLGSVSISTALDARTRTSVRLCRTVVGTPRRRQNIRSPWPTNIFGQLTRSIFPYSGVCVCVCLCSRSVVSVAVPSPPHNRSTFVRCKGGTFLL